MRKVSNPPPPGLTTPAPKVEAPAVPVTKATTTIEGKAKEDVADGFALKDPGLKESFNQLQGDMATIQRVLPGQDDKVLVIGTARSKPVPGENGYADYVWNEEFGAELRRLELSVGGGGGGGAMEAPLVGHAHMDAVLDMAAGRTVGWEAGEPTRQGSNIILPHEQAPSPYIGKDQLASYEKFLFRMQHLFRNSLADATTPGGFGTVAEVTALLAMKSHQQIDLPILFGAHDAYFDKFNAGLKPLLNERETVDLQNIFKDPKKAAQWVFDNQHKDTKFDLKTFVDHARSDLMAGFKKLDGQPKAIAFLGSMGARTQAAAPIMGEIAEAMAKSGNTLRVAGSPVLDPIVLKAAQKTDPEAEVQAFAMTDAPVESQKGLDYTKVEDVLVLRELMDSNLKGIVVSPEGAKQIAMLFTALCDMQTGEMPKIPVVVIDPDGKFADMKKMLADVMLSAGRKYINPEDLDLFKITTDPQEAIRILNTPPAAPAPTT